MENKTKKFFILNLIVFSISLVFLMFVILGSIWFENKLGKEKENLSLEQGKMNNLKDLNLMLNETKDKREYISSLFVTKESIIDFLELLEGIGKKTGSEVSVISVSEEPKVGFAGANRLKLEIVGSWTQVFWSIFMLDSLPATFSVKALALTQEEVDEKSKVKGLWHADVEGIILKGDK